MRKIRRRMTNRGANLDEKGNGGRAARGCQKPLAYPVDATGLQERDRAELRSSPSPGSPLFPVVVVNHLVFHNIRDA